METTKRLSGKRILISGAAGGIGRACALNCAAAGASTVLLGRNESQLAELRGQLEGENHQYFVYDLNDLEHLDAIFASALQSGEKLSGFLHAAGMEMLCPINMLPVQEMLKAFQINYFSFMMLVREFVKRKNSNGGSIVAVSSVAGSRGSIGMSVYSGTKGALDASVRSLALELSARHYRVNSIVPANIDTAMYGRIAAMQLPEQTAAVLERQPLGLGNVTDVAEAAVFLLSDASRFITGIQLPVDGGYLA